MKDSIISKLKNNKRALYLTVISVIVLLCLVLNVTFSAFTNSEVYEVANIKVGGLSYNITVNNVNTDIISAPSGNVTMANITLTSNNSIATTYELYYDVCADPACATIVNSVNDLAVKYSSDTIDDVSGTIGNNETKNTKLAIINDTNINYYIKLKVNAGFTNNTLTPKGLISTEYSGNEPKGWSSAASGTLLAGIKANYNGATVPLTNPGKELSSANEAVLASTEDDYGISYYFRGTVDNNYVVFANMCWKIVRITGNGDIKLILYNSLDASCITGSFYAEDSEKNLIETEFNSSSASNTYIGYMYGTENSVTYENEHENLNDSIILTELKTWYDRKFNTSQKNLLADSIWCNDKRIVDDNTYDLYLYRDIDATGIGAEATYYQAVKRLITSYDSGIDDFIYTSAEPSLKCGTSKNDNIISKFTSSINTDDGYGNGSLNGYKIGLLTVDEASYAGLIPFQENTNNYLYSLNSENGINSWWLLSPSFYGNGAENFFYDGTQIMTADVTNTFGIRPSISLTSTVQITSGTGTESSPFIIKEN